MKPLDYNRLEQLARIVTDTPEDAVYSESVAEWLELDKLGSVFQGDRPKDVTRELEGEVSGRKRKPFTVRLVAIEQLL